VNLYPAAGRMNRLTYVPIAAVVEGDGDRASVFVVSGDRVEERIVNSGQAVGDLVEITKGLKSGERVATRNVGKLADGLKVRP
jgi:multidrug efflux pump subunit AcrA (membrane-fusion protein)